MGEHIERYILNPLYKMLEWFANDFLYVDGRLAPGEMLVPLFVAIFIFGSTPVLFRRFTK